MKYAIAFVVFTAAWGLSLYHGDATTALQNVGLMWLVFAMGTHE